MSEVSLPSSDSPDPARPALLDQLMAISRAAALEEMASGIAHELNQPLGAITTFAQAGERMLNLPDVPIEEAREVFQLISREALAAADGIRRMRRLFRRDELIKATCAIEGVVQELTPALQMLADEVAIDLQVDIDPSLPPVSIDRLRIQHVLYTLTQNAFDASRADGVCKPATVRIEGRGDRYGVEIAVINSGKGIPEYQREQIFHPFFTTKPTGTGLGLASARAIVQAHEGTIGFETSPQGDTRFWFRLHATSVATP